MFSLLFSLQIKGLYWNNCTWSLHVQRFLSVASFKWPFGSFFSWFKLFTLIWTLLTRFCCLLGVTSIHILSHKTSMWYFWFNPHTHPWKHQLWPNGFFCCKTTCIGTIGNRATAKGLPTIPWWFYLTKIENIIIKITKSFTSFHTWHSKLLHWLVWQKLWILFQEVLISMHCF